jgi:hypothetical protein
MMMMMMMIIIITITIIITANDLSFMTDHFKYRENHEVFNYIFALICCIMFTLSSKSLTFLCTWNYFFLLKQLDMWRVVRKSNERMQCNKNHVLQSVISLSSTVKTKCLDVFWQVRIEGNIKEKLVTVSKWHFFLWNKIKLLSSFHTLFMLHEIFQRFLLP